MVTNIKNYETFTEVLNDPKSKEIVENIEDLQSSIDGNPEETLLEILADVISELKAYCGYEYGVES